MVSTAGSVACTYWDIGCAGDGMSVPKRSFLSANSLLTELSQSDGIINQRIPATYAACYNCRHGAPTRYPICLHPLPLEIETRPPSTPDCRYSATSSPN